MSPGTMPLQFSRLDSRKLLVTMDEIPEWKWHRPRDLGSNPALPRTSYSTLSETPPIATSFIHPCTDSACTCPGLGPKGAEICDTTSATEGLQVKQRQSGTRMRHYNVFTASSTKEQFEPRWGVANAFWGVCADFTEKKTSQLVLKKKGEIFSRRRR